MTWENDVREREGRAPDQPPQGRRRVQPRRGPSPAAISATISAAITFAVTFTLSWRPALWLDEVTTIALVRRDWTDLARVIWVREMPIAPYYVLMKVWTLPGTSAVWVRLPTVLAVTAAAGLLTWWLARVYSPRHGISAGLFLAVLPSMTRQAQEVRPYGFVVLSGVTAVVACAVYLDRPGRWRAVAFVVAVAFLPLWHALSLTLVPVLVLAAAAGGATLADGVRRAVRVAALAAVAVLLTSPFIYLAFDRAVGVAHPPPPTLGSWWLAFQQIVTPVKGGASTALLVGGLLAVVAVVAGLTRLREAAHRQTLVLLVLWATLHPAALLVMGTHGRSGILIGRYMMVSVPAWAALAGVGAATLGGLAARLVSRSGDATSGTHDARRPASAAALAWGLAAVVVAVPVGVVAASTWDSQREIRAADGHSTDIRPVIDLLRSPQYAQLPVAAQELYAGLSFDALAPDLQRRLVLRRDPAPMGKILTGDYTGPAADSRLRRYDRIAVVMPTFMARTPERALALKPQLKGWTVGSVWSDRHWMVVEAVRPAGA